MLLDMPSGVAHVKRKQTSKTQPLASQARTQHTHSNSSQSGHSRLQNCIFALSRRGLAMQSKSHPAQDFAMLHAPPCGHGTALAGLSDAKATLPHRLTISQSDTVKRLDRKISEPSGPSGQRLRLFKLVLGCALARELLLQLPLLQLAVQPQSSQIRSRVAALPHNAPQDWLPQREHSLLHFPSFASAHRGPLHVTMMLAPASHGSEDVSVLFLKRAHEEEPLHAELVDRATVGPPARAASFLRLAWLGAGCA